MLSKTELPRISSDSQAAFIQAAGIEKRAWEEIWPGPGALKISISRNIIDGRPKSDEFRLSRFKISDSLRWFHNFDFSKIGKKQIAGIKFLENLFGII